MIQPLASVVLMATTSLVRAQKFSITTLVFLYLAAVLSPAAASAAVMRLSSRSIAWSTLVSTGIDASPLATDRATATDVPEHHKLSTNLPAAISRHRRVAGRPDWDQKSSGGYRYQYSAVVSVTLDNGDEVTALNSMLAAFDLNGNFRSYVEIHPTLRYFLLPVSSDNGNGETFTFEVYDASSDFVYKIATALHFSSDASIGQIGSPYKVVADPVFPACTSHEYKATPVTPTSDTSCQSIRNCTSSEYETDAPNVTSDRQCQPVSSCANHQYETAAATVTSDRECSNTSLCVKFTEFEIKAPTTTSNRACRNCTQCVDYHFEVQPCQGQQDRTCDACAQCDPATQFLTADCVCQPVTKCTTGVEEEILAPSLTTDRLCGTSPAVKTIALTPSSAVSTVAATVTTLPPASSPLTDVHVSTSMPTLPLLSTSTSLPMTGSSTTAGAATLDTAVTSAPLITASSTSWIDNGTAPVDHAEEGETSSSGRGNLLGVGIGVGVGIVLVVVLVGFLLWRRRRRQPNPKHRTTLLGMQATLAQERGRALYDRMENQFIEPLHHNKPACDKCRGSVLVGGVTLNSAYQSSATRNNSFSTTNYDTGFETSLAFEAPGESDGLEPKPIWRARVTPQRHGVRTALDGSQTTYSAPVLLSQQARLLVIDQRQHQQLNLSETPDDSEV